MPGFIPGIHDFPFDGDDQVVDARHKAGHDADSARLTIGGRAYGRTLVPLTDPLDTPLMRRSPLRRKA